MKLTKLFFALLIIFSMTSFKWAPKDSIAASLTLKSREFYQIKTYILKTEQQEQTTDAYLKEAYLPSHFRLWINF